MHKLKKTFLLIGLSGVFPAAGAADLRSYSSDCEIALALSAAPEHLWASAGVYVLGENGYERVRESTNGFDCIVERNHRDSVIPQCFDAQSAKANLAVILDEGALLRQGESFEAVIERRAEVLAAGAYPEPGVGVAYMISDFNYIFSYDQNAMLKAAPHVMFHAPKLSAADIGADPRAAFSNRGLPILNAQGPHGFMVSFVERASPALDVEQSCAGQLPSISDAIAFPPPG